MSLIFRVALALLVCLAYQAEARIRQTADAIIVEAEYLGAGSDRRERSSVHEAKVPGSTVLMRNTDCWTPEGQRGFCGTVRSCYPNYKLPQLSNLETWVLGTRGTCHYVEPDGRQFYGLCCPIKSTDEIIFGEVNPPAKPETPDYISPSDPDALKLQEQQHIMAAKSGCGRGPYKTLTWDEQSRIVGGVAANPHEWPFIVSMQINGKHFCGGSIWKRNTIITAAHCISHFGPDDIPKLTVVAGLHSIAPVDDNAYKMKIVRIIRHIGYDGRTMFNDVALLVLSEPIPFDQKASSVCLPSGDENFQGSEAVAVGWGSLSEGGSPPSVLHKVTVQVLPNSDCKQKYQSRYEIVDHMVCAASPGRDSCQGDSGGPLVLQRGSGQPWQLVGIVSWGIGCAKQAYPGVYTRVTSFKGWMEKNSQ